MHLPVELVRFFGSRSHGTAPNDSDVDVMLVSPAFEGKDIFQRVKMMKGMHRALVRRLNVPVDIVFCSVSQWLHNHSPLLEENQVEGLKQAKGCGNLTELPQPLAVSVKRRESKRKIYRLAACRMSGTAVSLPMAMM